GQRTADSGQRTADSGQRTADSGQRTADSGQRTADSGQRTADSGQQMLVFQLEKFLQFLNNKEFLPDSFTAYKTKIGLATSDNRYLSEKNDVVLNFPYKDCILEGGQTKEDTKRQEIFFNKMLAPTEISRLLDDKVLTNFKRFDEQGEHEVETLHDTDNFIIKGNNLIALHGLKKRFAGKVKLIYIDMTLLKWIQLFTPNTLKSA
ncbi:site-specific DNA-methyltransferase, partial [Aerococcaceae bacterium NML210727]|nr:site-specific DNA-methyltransferase [Aerococcaceae bacterium NML210727]MCW6664942.1 site-specific DNA-methyltransferase [Aerococcaceae bacterium NML191219]